MAMFRENLMLYGSSRITWRVARIRSRGWFWADAELSHSLVQTTCLWVHRTVVTDHPISMHSVDTNPIYTSEKNE